MDVVDQKILNQLQFDFPLDLCPYQKIGEAVGIPEGEVLERIGRLRGERVIREISAIFDTRNLGHTSSLVAMKIDEAGLKGAAKKINDFPGVSHNYKREAAFNLWFTVAVPPGRDLNETVKILAFEADAESTLVLPTLRLFKIGVRLDVTGESTGLEQEEPQQFKQVRRDFSREEIQTIRALQQDLPLEPRPFKSIAARIGVPEEEVFRILHSFINEGVMRRYAAVLYHRRAGFAFNGMGVWKVPPDQVETFGLKMGSFRGVSHCYHRPAYPEWPYSLYTMVHGKKKEDCEKIIQGISEAVGIADYRILYSTVEYKKERIEYFSPKFDAWYAGHACPDRYLPRNLRLIEPRDTMG